VNSTLLTNCKETVLRNRPITGRLHQGQRALVAALSFTLLTTASWEALAIGKVAVIPFTGVQVPVVQRALFVTQRIVTSAIPPAYTLASANDVNRILGGGQPAGNADYASLARRLGATALIDGNITIDRRRWRLRVTVRRATSGAPVGTVTWSGIGSKPLISNLNRNANQWIASLLQRTGGPTAEPPPAQPGDERPMALRSGRGGGSGAGTDEESASLSASGEPGGPRGPNSPTMWSFSVGPRLISRAFLFTDNSAGLSDYSLPGAAALAGEAELYPFLRTSGPLRNLGAAGYYETSIGAKTQRGDGSTVATTARGYRVGGRYRIPIESSAIILGTDYSQHYFNLRPDGANPVPPNVTYTAVRPSIGGRVPMGSKMALSLSAAYLHILGVGELAASDRFPRVRSAGAEADAVLTYMLDDELDVGLGADLRYYAHAMNAQVGDNPQRLVGGALDVHFGAHMMLTYRLP
jgi:hypothetical protein